MIRKPGKTLSATRSENSESPINQPEAPPYGAYETACHEPNQPSYDETNYDEAYAESLKPYESRKNGEALRDSEARFRAVFENAAVGIARVAPDGRWLEVNQRLCDIVGYSREELMTKTFADITHPGDLDKNMGGMRRMLAGETDAYLTEKRYYRKDGSVVWINLTMSMMRKTDGS